MESILALLNQNKDTFTILIAAFTGIIGLVTFVKAIMEYRLQGRQKRAELFDYFKNTLKTEERLVTIVGFLEDDNPLIADIPQLDRYFFLGFYEQIAIALNSGLLKKDVAHYMFSYFALRCWESENFWIDINRDSYYWSVFKKFIIEMQRLENRNINKGEFYRLWDYITGRDKFKY